MTKKITDLTKLEISKERNPEVVLGVSDRGELIGGRVSELRHILICGQAGSGKSVFDNTVIYQLVKGSTPENLQVIIFDPLKLRHKKDYLSLPHFGGKVITTLSEAIQEVDNIYQENIDRYYLLERLGYENINDYNQDIEKGVVMFEDKLYKLPTNLENNLETLPLNVDKDLKYKAGDIIPQIIVSYDEPNCLHLESEYANSIEKIKKLLEQSRKAGIFFYISTQKVSSDTLPSSISDNCGTRICLKVSSKVASERMIGTDDGFNLKGKGDFLVRSNLLYGDNIVKGQCFFIGDEGMSLLVNEEE